MSNITRRDFVKVAAVSSAAVSTFNILGAGTQNGLRMNKVKLGVIGCGGRGTGATQNFLTACETLGLEVDIVAVADIFEDRVVSFAQKAKVDPAKSYFGFEAYKKVAESDAEFVIMATPPNFRPWHLEACIEGGKHCFIEKPVAVDPVGARKVLEVGEVAKKKGLAIVAGTQRRYDKKYRQTKAMLEAGAIGEIVGGVISWNGKVPWINPRKPGQSVEHYLARNWLNFTELSGDHIVEQHIHQLDVANWYMGRVPKTFVGFGGRARRETGNQFDFFSIDMDYGDGIHIHSQCRQISGCYNRVGETFKGIDGHVLGTKVSGKDVSIKPIKQENDDGIVQEHIELIKSVRGKGEPINKAKPVTEATLCAIGGRISAYTGQLVRWVDLTLNENSPVYSMQLSPNPIDFERGNVILPDEVPAIPGDGAPLRVKG
jgi:predicted dehydrogenase